MPLAFAISLQIGFLLNIQFEFISDTQRIVELLRSEEIVIGSLDANGEFNLDHVIKFPKDGILYRFRNINGNAKTLGVNSIKPVPVYELRSGTLISGTMKAGGPFVPTVDSKITRFEDYVYSESARLFSARWHANQESCRGKKAFISMAV
jgi:hypothetical protein